MNLGIDTASLFCEYYKISTKWLLMGKGEMILGKENEALPIKQNLMKVVRVPIHAQAGFLNGYGDEAYMDELPFEYWEVDKEYKGNYVVFEVKGDSMDDNSVDSILDGDRILCREIMQHHWTHKLHISKWNFVIVHKKEGIIVKRIIRHDVEKGLIICHSLNPYYDDFEVNLSDVIALFNVVDMKRTLRL
jgi:phage repressor protein C with HTH and peptisase S24 domain